MKNREEKLKKKVIELVSVGGTDKELVVLQAVDDLENKFDDSIQEVANTLNDKIAVFEDKFSKIDELTASNMDITNKMVTNILKDIKGKDAVVDYGHILDEVKKIIPPPEKGDNYVLTEQDKKDIAGSVIVPERIIEKVEVIKEQPIVTNQIVEVLDEKKFAESIPKFGTGYRDALELLPEGDKLNINAIENLRKELDEAKKMGESHRVIGANRNLYQLLDVNVSGITVDQSIKWNGTQWVAYTPSAGGGGTPGGSNTQLQYNNAGAFGGITGATSDGTTVTLASPIISSATASTIAGYDASKVLGSLSTVTYPSLTELSYVKGVTSAIQTQIDGKQATGTYVTGATNATLTLTGTTLGLTLSNANTWTGQQTFNTSAAIFGVGMISPKWYPSADSTTAMQILKADGTTNILNVDSTNSRIGIGTTTPSTTLEVKGAWTTNKGQLYINTPAGQSFSGLVTAINGAAIGFFYSQDSDKSFQIWNNYGGGTTSGAIRFFTNGASSSEKLTILDNGNVGINTANPSVAQFVITGTGQYMYTGGSGTATLYSQVQNTGGRYYQGVDNSTGTALWTGGLAYASSFGSGNATALQLATNNIVRMTILSGGNVGIGTTAPAQKLSIEGTGLVLSTIKTTDNTGAGAFQAINDAGSTIEFGRWGSARTPYGAISSGDGYIYGSTGGFAISADSASGVIKFLTGSSIPERMRIDATGNVGMGITSPSAALHIVKTTEQLRVGYDASNYYKTTVGSTGGVTLDAVGSGASFTFNDAIINTLPIRLKGYTVAGLPAGTTGDTAYVTDALAPTYLTAVVGGGAVTTQVFYNGSAWIAS